MEDYSPLENDEMSEYDIYSKTPPRTKILRKNRERKQRDKNPGLIASSPKISGKSRGMLNRRCTVSAMYDELISNVDHPDLDQGGKRTSKRHMKLLRDSERDLKLDIGRAQTFSGAHQNGKSEPKEEGSKPPCYQIEGYKRFMSLSCRTVPCFKLLTGGKKSKSGEQVNYPAQDEQLQSRINFYNTLSMLVRMGSNENKSGCTERNPRRILSREETMFQNDLKDVIWLELQAFHADRTPMEEDAFLCEAREKVEPLLKDIMNYRYQPHRLRKTSQASDSGFEDCSECVSIYCVSCAESQNSALFEIESLMLRLEHVEALFPSSKAFAELYPLYNSPEFVGRVKAISLWYNMTKHQRLKLSILGRLLSLMETTNQWPLLSDEIHSESPSDSNNSTGSSQSDFYSYGPGKNPDLYNIAPVARLMNHRDENNVSPYRRYIENVLKTRALHKSLSFLDRLHENVLRKAQLTLEKPSNPEIFKKLPCESDDDELMRYGAWSPEAKALNLPSYRTMFTFLAAVPLDIIYEYLLMRLEQKPDNPSPLSVRQLMRELKEGLRIATIERDRIIHYIESAFTGTKQSTLYFDEKIKLFDGCLIRVFTDYLDYLEQWALLHHDTFQKNLVEEEYQFSCKVIQDIPGGFELLANKFSMIMACMLKRIGERLMAKIEQFLFEIPKNDDCAVKQYLVTVSRKLQSLFNEEREMSLKTMAFCKTLLKLRKLPDDCRTKLSSGIISFKCLIPGAISKIQSLFEVITKLTLDESDKVALNSRIREILMQVYRFGFEFYKELSESIPSNSRHQLARGMVHFANLWMIFVTERCERGRGMRPRWAFQGLEFLLTVCEPSNTQFLTEEEFEDLKKNMDVCISHVIGTTAPSTPDSGFYSASPKMEQLRNRSRGSSPSPRPSYKSQRSNASIGSANSRKTSVEQTNTPSPEILFDGLSITNGFKHSDKTVRIKLPPKTKQEERLEAVEVLETELDDRLRKQELIGKVLTNTENKTHFRRRNVTFSWQRGIKIGQGRFGKVYTAVNNNTGEMMAVKEIALQHNDAITIKKVAEEMKILEGIVHQNLVRYYGMEVHKNEMLLFMEFCAEGTLEGLVKATEGGLSELLVRRYTFQLVSGVEVLHLHGIVHRDIKTANIFLTDEGNCLKIGDFGCAAKIKSNSTMPGELQGFVGTQAYMAPEVFTKNMAEGHGRAADIWSVGCVVVEMASGKRPWAQFDSNYQIMFKVGMGQSPDPPDDMIDEGLDFLELCFKNNPRERATAHQLLAHNFVKAGNDLN